MLSFWAFNVSVHSPLKKNTDDCKDLTCRTEKEKQGKLNERTAGKNVYRTEMHYNILRTTVAGILAGMWPCGIIVFVHELFISESLSQVYGILHEFLKRHEAVSDGLSEF